jgi:hypothetical protein
LVAADSLPFVSYRSETPQIAALFHIHNVVLGTILSFLKVHGEAHVRCRGGLGDQQVGQREVGEQQMKKTAFLFLIFAMAAYPAVAKRIITISAINVALRPITRIKRIMHRRLIVRIR